MNVYDRFILAIFLMMLITLTLLTSNPVSGQAQGGSGENVDFVNQIGGQATNFVVQNNYAYVARGSRLMVVDLSNVAAPALVAELNGLPEEIYNLDILGNYVYLALNSYGVGIVDITDPTNPIYVDTHHPGGYTHDIYISGNFAYLANGGLRILDLTNPTAPVDVSHMAIHFLLRAKAVHGAGSTVYLRIDDNEGAILGATQLGNIQSVDVTDIANPVSGATFKVDNRVEKVYASTNYLYVTTQVPVYDTENGFSLFQGDTEVGTFHIPGGAGNLQIVGDTAYVVANDGSLYILDVNTPASPIQLNNVTFSQPAIDIWIADSTLYVLSDGGDITVFNTADVTNLVELGSFHALGEAVADDVALGGDIAYVAGGDSGLWLLNINNPVAPVEVAHLNSPAYAHEIEVVDDIAYVLLFDGVHLSNSEPLGFTNPRLWIVDVSDPTNPTHLNLYDLVAENPTNLQVLGNRVYLADGIFGLIVLEFTDFSTDPAINRFQPEDEIQGVYVIDNIAYVVSSFKLYIVNVSSMIDFIELGNHDLNFIWYPKIYVGDNVAYIGHSEGLMTVDVSDPANPSRLSTDTQVDNVKSLIIMQSVIYAVSNTFYNQSVYLLDAADATNPTQLGFYPLAAPMQTITTHNNYVYIANGIDGLVILKRLSGPYVNLSHTIQPRLLNVGQAFDYTIQLENLGTETATNINLTNSLPTGQKALSATLSQGTCTLQANGQEISCHLDTLDVNQRLDIVVSAEVSSTISINGQPMLNIVSATVANQTVGVHNSEAEAILQNCHVQLNNNPTIYTTVQAAVDASDQPTDIVKISGYCAGATPNNKGIQTIYLDKSISLSGGWNATFSTRDINQYPTTLDALSEGRVILIDGEVDVLIEGLRITGGDTHFIRQTQFHSPYSDSGGGILGIKANITLNHNQIFSNTAQVGGGFDLADGNIALFKNLIAYNHSLDGSGGGGEISHYTNTFAQVSLLENTIIHNHSTDRGGGVSLYNVHALIQNNLIQHNATSNGTGGGLSLVWGNEIIISDNVINHNQAVTGGGLDLQKMASGQVFNNIIAKNQATLYGNGIYLFNAPLQFSHNTIVSNRGLAQDGIFVNGYDPSQVITLFNTILADHQTGLYAAENTNVSLTNTLWAEGPLANDADWDGPGMVSAEGNNIWVDPGFVDPNNDNYHLQENSPAVDAGNDAGISTDIDNQPRPARFGFDLGADEVPGSIIITKNTPHTIVAPGQEISYTITLSNTTALTQQIVVTDILPNHTYYNGSMVIPSEAITWEIPTLPPFGTWQQVLVLTISPDYVGSLVNVVKASNQGGEVETATSRVFVSRQNIDVTPNQSGTIIALNNNGLTTTIEIPASAVSQPTQFVYTPLETVDNSDGQFSFMNVGFQLHAQQSGSGSLEPHFIFNTPVRVTLHYQDNMLNNNEENRLTLRWWNGTTWLDAAETCNPASAYTRDTVNNILSVDVCHLTDFALFKANHHLFLPVVMRNHEPGRLTIATSNNNNNIQPAISPDKESIIFVSDREGQMDIFHWPDINLSQTPDATEDTPIFSPDGQQIIFASNRSGDWDIYRMNLDGTNVRRLVGLAGSNELHPTLTPDGQRVVFTSDLVDGNWDIYVATVDDGPWTRLTTHPTPDRFPGVSPDGNTILFRNEADGNSNIYTMSLNGGNLQQFTTDASFNGYPTFTPDGSGILFVSNRSGLSQLYVANLAGQNVTKVVDLPGWEMNFPRLAADGQTLLYARRLNNNGFDIYRTSINTPLEEIATKGFAAQGDNCNWESGVLGYGSLQAWQSTGNMRYYQLTKQWLDSCLTVNEIDHVNDGLYGYAALVIYEQTGETIYLDFAENVADYLMNIANRTNDGTISHDDNRAWIDTVLGSVPFLLKMGEVSGNTLYTDEAVTQLLNHATHLQDPETGLYQHAWDETGSSIAGYHFWGRGNGWALMADVAALSTLDPTHPQYNTILGIMQAQAAGLKSLQDDSGLWPTIVTRPDFYLETSATALIGYGLKQGIAHGWLEKATYAETATRAERGLWTQVSSDGTVNNVSSSTWPMLEEEYGNLPHNELELYGQGVALLIGSPVN